MKEVLTHLGAYEILDSRGNPALAVTASTKNYTVTEYVPSGASTGIHEALELRDQDHRYHGQGLTKAIHNVENIILPKLKGKAIDPAKMDDLLIALDGTSNKSRLGANSILGVSLCMYRLKALIDKKELWQLFSTNAEDKNTKRTTNKKDIEQHLPLPYMNILNGGRHAVKGLSIQEIMIIPHHKEFSKRMQMASETYQELKELLKEKGLSANVGDEGGFVPHLNTTEEALSLLVTSINRAGYTGSIKIALDCAASEFYRNGIYTLDGKKMNSIQLGDYYHALINKFPIISIEDPFAQDDFIGWKLFKVKTSIDIVGDDLLVTNPTRIKMAIEKDLCTALLLKVNQIGTVTEALRAHQLAQDAGWKTIVSHRSGETTSTFIADLAVGIGAHLKAGAPCRGERTAKYNRLLEIERS